MATRTFEDVYEDTMRHYGAQEFEQALDVLTREGDAFPEEAHQVLYLRSCLAARTGQTELSLSLIQEALDKGLWYNRQMMRESPSWKVLQGLPEFEQMVEVCAVREDEAHGEPELFVTEPTGGFQEGQTYPLFLTLHGNMSNAQQALRGWHRVVDEGWILAAAQSSQVTTANMYIWDNQETAMRELEAHYKRLCAEYPVDTEKVLVVGFSMGGETALRAVLSGIIPARGFILLGPGGPTVDQPEAWLPTLGEGRARGTRGYILMGDADGIIEPEELRKLTRLLASYGIPCEIEVLPGLRHEYPRDFAVVQRALDFVMR